MLAAFKNKSAASWSTWLKQLDEIQAEREEITGLEEARKDLERAENHARFVIGLANQSPAMGNFYHTSDEQDRATLLDLMGQIAGMASKVRSFSAFSSQTREYQESVIALDTRSRQAAASIREAAATVEELEGVRAEVEERLEALKQKAPKASASGLAELRKERDTVATERDRIAAALDNFTADDSPLALAREAERAATERLEEAEALLALGEADGEEVKAAKAAAEKARQALEKRQAEHRSQEAARRGMARKLEQADSHLDALNRSYREVLARVRDAELAALESELVTELERVAGDRLKKLAEIYADLEEAFPGSSYGRALLEIRLPHLYHHAERDLLNRGLTITAYGREE